MDQNPFWWDIDQSEIVTHLVSTIITLEGNRSSVFVSTTPTPLDIFLSIQYRMNSTTTGSAFLPLDDVDSTDKDLSVTVFRIIPPLYGGGGKLFVKFVDFNHSDSLRVGNI